MQNCHSEHKCLRSLLAVPAATATGFHAGSRPEGPLLGHLLTLELSRGDEWVLESLSLDMSPIMVPFELCDANAIAWLPINNHLFQTE